MTILVITNKGGILVIIPKITDAYVTLDTVRPQSVPGLDKSAIFVAGQTQSFKQYVNIEAVNQDYDYNSSVSKIANVMFDQEYAPQAVNVINYVKSSGAATAPTPSNTGSSSGSASSSTANTNDANQANYNSLEGAAKAAYDYFYLDWEFAILADYDKTEALNLATLIDNGGYDGKGYHLFFQQFGPSNVADATAFDGFNRTWKFYHTDESEYYAAALLGNTSSRTVGQVSWKFSSNLSDVTPETITASAIEQLDSQGFILYAQKGNNANSTNDANKQGYYIDFIHGEDWVKANIESAVQDLFASPTGRIKFNSDGITRIYDAIKGQLDQATTNGIIETDSVSNKPIYTITPPDINSITETQKATRILNNYRFSYTGLNGINEVHIHGVATA